MEPDYVVHIAGMSLERDAAYKPSVEKVFERFPALGLVVHELATNGDRLVMRFSEHAATASGALACWAGIGLYDWNGSKLTSCRVEQDFWSQRRQLATGVPDALEPPHLDPWVTTVAAPVDPAAETVVRRWLADSRPGRRVRRSHRRGHADRAPLRRRRRHRRRARPVLGGADGRVPRHAARSLRRRLRRRRRAGSTGAHRRRRHGRRRRRRPGHRRARRDRPVRHVDVAGSRQRRHDDAASDDSSIDGRPRRPGSTCATPSSTEPIRSRPGPACVRPTAWCATATGSSPWPASLTCSPRSATAPTCRAPAATGSTGSRSRRR